MACKPLPEVSRILQLMTYNPQTGLFTYRHCPNMGATWNKRCQGRPALTYNNGNGYVCGIIDGQKVYAHRVAWKVTYGSDPEFIDHINGDRSDNRISNLRSVSNTENARNTRRHVSNKTGVMGVHWYKAYSKWQVYIGYKPRVNIGYFSCLGEAIKARRKAEKENAYHPNHNRSCAS